MRKGFIKLLGVVCVLSVLVSALFVPTGLGASAASIPVEEDETILFSFEPEEDPITSNAHPENYSRAGDGCGIVGWGINYKAASVAGVNCIGHIHDYDANWADPGGYRLNNKDGVYNLETNTTYVVSFKVKVKSVPIKEGSLSSNVTSVLKVGYGFTGVADGVNGNKCSTMHVAVADVVKANSVAKTEKDNATYTLTDMLGSKEVKVSDEWHEVTYVFETPDAFGSYAPSLGFFTSAYHGTYILVDEVEVTKLADNKGAVVLLDEYSGTSEILTGEIDTAVELPTLSGSSTEHEFNGWFKDEARSESAEGLTFTKGVQEVYSAWKAPVTVTFIDTLNGGTPYTVSGIAGDKIVYPEKPVDGVNEPDEMWFMGWYTTESYTEEFTSAYFGYTNVTVYSKWQGEYSSSSEDFENYTLDKKNGPRYDSNRGNIYANAFYFGTAMQKWDDPTNSGKGKVIAFPWDSTMTKDASDRNSDPASYNAATFYKGADNIVQIKGAQLEVGVTYKVSFEYFVEKMADTNNLTIYPIAAHESGYWSTMVNFKNDQDAYTLITPDANDGEWHTGEMIFTMKKAAATNDVIHFMFDLKENTDATVYMDNVVFTPVQPNEAIIVYVANNGDGKRIVEGVPGEAIPEYIPENKGLAFGGWYTDSACTTKYEKTVFEGGGTTLYAKWIGKAVEFTDYKKGPTSIFGQQMYVLNDKAGEKDDWAIKWHYDGDEAWKDPAGLAYGRGAIYDHVINFGIMEKGVYEISYSIKVEKATNDFSVQFFTTNSGWVWDTTITYPSSYKAMSKDTAGDGWITYTTMINIDTDAKYNNGYIVNNGLYMSFLAKNRTADDEIILYVDRVVMKPVENSIIFNTGLAEREDDWQIGNVGEKIKFPKLSTVQNELFAGWFTDKECTVPYTHTTLQEGNVDVYAKWDGELIEFTNYKKASAATFGNAMYVEQVDAGFEDDWAIKWHYDGDEVWKDPAGVAYTRGSFADHAINLKVLEKGTYEVSYMLNVQKASNDFAVQFFTTNIGYLWDPTVSYPSSYKLISKDTAGKGWIRYSVMIDIDTDYAYREWDGRDVIVNNGLFMGLVATDRTPNDENIVYVDSVVIKKTDTAVMFNTNSTASESTYQKGKAGDTIKYPANPKKDGYDFIGWYADKDCTVPFNEKVLKADTVFIAYAGYERSKTVMHDFEDYGFSNPTGWFVWDEGGEVVLFNNAYSGKRAARFNRDLEVTHNGRSSFTVVGDGSEKYIVDPDKEYLVTFKYYVEKAGEKDAKISFTSGHPTSYWHKAGSLSSNYVVPFSEKTGVWYDGVLVLDGSKIQDPNCNAVFVVVSGGDNGIYYVDDVEITIVPDGYKAYTVDNGGCDKVPMYVMGKLGSSFAKQLPNAPKMTNHHFGGYTMYDVNNNLSDLLPEKMVFGEENIRIVANFIRIETVQDFEDGYDALLNAYGDYSAIDFDYEHYDSRAEGNSKDNVTSGRYSLHRKGESYFFENAQVLTSVKSLTPNQKYTVTMKVKLGKHFHTDGAIKLVSCRTPFYPWASSGDYFSIAAIKDLKEGEWTEVSFTFTAVESYISLQTPGYVELFIDDIVFNRVDGTVDTSKNVSYTEYVPAKRDADGNLVVKNPMDISVESIIDDSLSAESKEKETLLSTVYSLIGSPAFLTEESMLYVLIGAAALVVLIVVLVVVLVLGKKRKNKKA